MDLNELIRRHGVVGAAAAVVENGRITVHHAGLSDSASGRAVDADTVFDAASLTKPLVAHATLQLHDEGVLDLDAPVAHWVKLRDIPNEHAARITVRHLLTHTAGLQNLRARDEPIRLHFKPGQWFSYSSLGFAVLQHVLEAVTGKPLERMLAERVFGPLGMTSSALRWEDRFAGREALPHDDGVQLEKHRPAAAFASCSLQTTALDYARLVRAVLSGDGLAPGTHRAMLAPQVMAPLGAIERLTGPPTAHEADVAWGLGWGVEPSHGAFFHWGKMQGIRAFVMGSPAHARGVVLLTNSNTGLRLMRELAPAVGPGDHDAIGWLEAGVSE